MAPGDDVVLDGCVCGRLFIVNMFFVTVLGLVGGRGEITPRFADSSSPVLRRVDMFGFGFGLLTALVRVFS